MLHLFNLFLFLFFSLFCKGLCPSATPRTCGGLQPFLFSYMQKSPRRSPFIVLTQINTLHIRLYCFLVYTFSSCDLIFCIFSSLSMFILFTLIPREQIFSLYIFPLLSFILLLSFFFIFSLFCRPLLVYVKKSSRRSPFSHRKVWVIAKGQIPLPQISSSPQYFISYTFSSSMSHPFNLSYSASQS